MPRNPLNQLLRRFPPWARALSDWLLGIAIAVAIVLTVRAWVATPYAIPTPSMEPTLRCSSAGNSTPEAPSSSLQPGQGQAPTTGGQLDPSTYQCQGSSFLGHSFADRVLVNRFVYRFRSPRRGEIVVFKPTQAASELCEDLDTDVLVKRLVGLPGDHLVEKRGVLFVNGKKLEEPYLEANRRGTRRGDWRVGEGRYFFMGDNRQASCDSRRWGSVPRENLIGPVFMTYWPPNRISFD